MPCSDCICDCVKKEKKALRVQGLKKCKKCDIVKPKNEFDAKRAECKECRKDKNLEYYNKKTKKKNDHIAKRKMIFKLMAMKEFEDMKELLEEKAKTII